MSTLDCTLRSDVFDNMILYVFSDTLRTSAGQLIAAKAEYQWLRAVLYLTTSAVAFVLCKFY